MFCFQCQETAKGTGCILSGVCGKTPEVANMQDLLLFVVRGIAVYNQALRKDGRSSAPPYIAISLTMLELKYAYFRLVVRNTVSIPGAATLLVCDIASSYSKSVTALNPLIITETL